MKVEELILKLQACRPDAIVLTNKGTKDILTDYFLSDTMTEVVKIYQGIGYKVINDAPGGQWIGSEPFNDYTHEPLQGVPVVYIGDGTSVKELLWEKK
jgi:hypothetical protein